MSTGWIVILVAGLVIMMVYAAVSLRALVRMRRARALVLAADMPEHVDAGHPALTFATAKRWFDGKDCADCGRPIAALHRIGPQPGLKRRAPGHHPILTWDEVPAGSLALLAETYVPLCANCQIAESLREDYPDRVVQRTGSTASMPQG